MDCALAIIAGGRPVKQVCDVLSVARSNAAAKHARPADRWMDENGPPPIAAWRTQRRTRMYEAAASGIVVPLQSEVRGFFRVHLVLSSGLVTSPGSKL
ncbi:MAG: putative transposase [Paraburkholderia sp.]|nr:putative transposase [Paraburkholderia sp.]